ncbi:MAG: hypothetical protein ACLPLZ_10575 [Terracidiphilus sp.]
MRTSIMFGLTKVFLTFVVLVLFSSCIRAQHSAHPLGSRIPWACQLLSTGEENAEKSDPEEEQNYSRGFNDFYRLWCTSVSSSPRAKEDAADAMAERWKRLWYRDPPYNAAFHEVGSFELLVVIAITRKLPGPLVADPKFMQDWLKDCKGSCFQIFGNDDPSAKAESLRLLRLRNDVMDHLKGDPEAKPVLEMLKNARLDDLVK